MAHLFRGLVGTGTEAQAVTSLFRSSPGPLLLAVGQALPTLWSLGAPGEPAALPPPFC